MPLLNLPLEVFEEVIAALAKKVGRRNLVQYRLISSKWTFANTIKDCILNATAQKNLAEFLNDPPSARLFEEYSGEILYKSAMRDQTTRNQVVDFVRATAKETQPDSTLYPARVMVLCMSMMALEPRYLRAYIKGTEIVNKENRPCSLKDMMLAVATASGYIGLFKNPTLTPGMLLKQSHDLLPSALKAAIVADQYVMLGRILEYLVDNVYGKHNSGLGKDMSATRKIGKALCVAIRLHKNVAGNMLFDFRDKNELFARSAPDNMGTWLVNDAIKYCNTALLYRVLEVDNPKFVAHVKDRSNPHYSLDCQSMETLYRRGGTVIWNMLLRDGAIGPNKVYSAKAPLQYALQRRRLANDGYVKDVEFLLNHGADPSSRGKNGESAIAAAVSAQYGKCRFLLEAVRDHGKEYLKRSDLWLTYEPRYCSID